MSLIDNSTRSGLSIRKCPKRGLTLLRAGLDTWLISPRTYPKNSNLMDKMSRSKIRRDKESRRLRMTPRDLLEPPIKGWLPRAPYVEPMNLGFLKYYVIYVWLFCIFFCCYDFFSLLCVCMHHLSFASASCFIHKKIVNKKK